MKITLGGKEFHIVRTVVGRGAITMDKERHAVLETKDGAIIGRSSWFEGNEFIDKFHMGGDAFTFFEAEFPEAFNKYVKKLEGLDE